MRAKPTSRRSWLRLAPAGNGRYPGAVGNLLLIIVLDGPAGLVDPHTPRASDSPIPPSRSRRNTRAQPVVRTPSTPGNRADSTARPAVAPRRPKSRPVLAYHDGTAASPPEPPPARQHQTDRNPARDEDRPLHVKASRHGVLRRDRADLPGSSSSSSSELPPRRRHGPAALRGRRRPRRPPRRASPTPGRRGSAGRGRPRKGWRLKGASPSCRRSNPRTSRPCPRATSSDSTPRQRDLARLRSRRRSGLSTGPGPTAHEPMHPTLVRPRQSWPTSAGRRE